MRAFLDYIAGKESDDSFVQELEEAVKKAKKNRTWRLEYMTLLMRDQENMEKGRQQGVEQGIRAMILDNLEEGVPKERIFAKLQKRFHLTEEKAKEYYGKFSTNDNLYSD